MATERKHSINIQLEEGDWTYLEAQAARIKSTPTKLAHDLLCQIIRIRQKNDKATLKPPITPSAQPTSLKPPLHQADAPNAGKRARETLNKRNQKSSFFSKLFSKK